MTPGEKEKLAQRALGTCDSPDTLAEWAEAHLGLAHLDGEDIEDALLDENIEPCPECEWWCESPDLVDEDDNPCPCQSCRA